MDGHDLLSIPHISTRLFPRSRRQAILIAGGNRSGTSLLAHLLHAFGAALPADVIGPACGNPLGHFEPSALVALNDRILAALDRSWKDPRPIETSWFRSPRAYGFVQDIIIEIGRGYGAAPLILVKDPRICRLLPLYLTALDVLDIEPLVILMVRPAQEVAISLVQRDGLDPALAELMWLRSIIEAEGETRLCTRVWLSLEQLITNWRQASHLVATSLGARWMADPDEVATEVASFLKPRLCHTLSAPQTHNPQIHNPETHNPATHHPPGVLSAKTWEAVELGLAGDESGAQTCMDAIRLTLRDIDRMYMPCLANVARHYEEALTEIHASKSWRYTAPLRRVRRFLAAF